MIMAMSSVYMIMEMATGGTLLDVIKKDRYLDEQRSCRWFHHLIEGITYIHGKGYVHRDLKCENMLLDKHGVLKIIDFGFAKGGLDIDVEVTSPTEQLSTTFCGSYAYACTEILKKMPYEPHLADMWSMGVILFVMLYGKFPFNSSNLSNLVKQTQKAIDFPESPSTSIDAKKLISRILKPERQRIYLPEGYVHRDLKCENLLLDKGETLKIIDFGFAKGGLEIDVEATSTRTQLSSTFCGSYAYASAEILKKIPYEPHLADMWSIGVILFVMLYGRFPFSSNNLVTLVRQTEKPLEFPRNPPTSVEAKLLISRILKSEKKRAYLPQIKKDEWYRTTMK
ncbi:TSSK4 [Cordylochernes scorpioides]|uniref:TSSK4 n=1 Tax=Cordylochernes scorpioides TaxID=51811 RepID=A0ABY6JYT9_9ARAC|nr:TSSK4 [Cordylochernes scorpioides]